MKKLNRLVIHLPGPVKLCSEWSENDYENDLQEISKALDKEDEYYYFSEGIFALDYLIAVEIQSEIRTI